jgi:5'(3')-deoxyribonucleotidase|tara:strand:- start:1898 stop:2446 length:549 start_codon:yes stop_codon:yes gene_type:complete
MRIGIDLDGVVADFTKGWTSHYKKQFGREIKEEHIVSWGLSKPLTHFEKEEDFWKWAKNLGGSTIFRHLDTYEESVETLKKLSLDGHNIVIISSKPWWTISDTFLWLGEKEIPTREVHFIEDKWKVDCDIYLDDSPDKLKEYLDKRSEKVIVRFIRPYNKPLKDVKDVTSWKEFYSLVKSLS